MINHSLLFKVLKFDGFSPQKQKPNLWNQRFGTFVKFEKALIFWVEA